MWYNMYFLQIVPEVQDELNIVTTGDSLTMQLNIAFYVGIFIAVFTILAVFILYKEPNPHGLYAIIRTGRRDFRLLDEQVKSSKKLPLTGNGRDILGLFYGLYDDKYRLLVGAIMDLVERGIYKTGVVGEDKKLYLVRAHEIEANKKGLTADYVLADILGSRLPVKELHTQLKASPEKVEDFLNLYVNEELARLHHNELLGKHRKIHHIDVYYPSAKTRQAFLEIRRVLHYFEHYGIERLEVSTQEKDIPSYSRMLVMMTDDEDLEKLEAINSEGLAQSLMFGKLLRNEVANTYT